MRKKINIIAIVAIFLTVLIIGVGYWLIFSKKKTKVKKESKSTKMETVNQLSLKERPYIIIEPKSKTRPQDYGYWMTITINNASNYKLLEYEVEYQAGNLIQGFMHRLDFSKEKLPISQEGFFGSESKGKYKYDEGVKNGNVLFKFFKNSHDYEALKTYFNWQQMEQQKGVFTSNDAKAILEIKSKELKPSDYMVVFSTLGLPAEIKGEALSEPYGFYSRQPMKLKSAVLTIKNKKDLTGAKILGWDGKKWHQYESEIKEDEVSAKVDELGTYILVK